jgi:hypothetical protein
MALRLKTNQDAVNFLRENKIREYYVSTSGDTTEKANRKIFDADPEQSEQDNLDKFLRIVEMGNGSYFLISKGKNGVFRVEVMNSNYDVTTVQSQIAGISGDERARIREEAREEYKREYELEDLREEVKELRTEVNRKYTAFEQALTTLQPYIGTIAGVLTQKIVGIPALQNTTVAGTNSNIEHGDLENIEL